MRSGARIALGALACALAAGAAFAAFGWRALHAELPIPSAGAWLEVANGTPLRRVTAELAQRDLLDHPVLLDLYARLRGDATRIRAGEYQLAPGTTPLSLVDKLVSGQVFQHQLTIVEGWRFAPARSTDRRSWRSSASPACTPRGSSSRTPISSRAAPPTSSCSRRRTRRYASISRRPGRLAPPTSKSARPTKP